MLWMLCLPNASLFLLLLPCFSAQDGGGNEQSTDVISAWEGNSINITCPMNGSQNQVMMHLNVVRKNLNVINFSKKEPPKINPRFLERTECSEEGENFRITLNMLQESDSEIYQCSEITEINGHHADQYGKTTIVVVKAIAFPPFKKAKHSRVLKQSPLYANPEQGQSVNITCVLNGSAEEFYLLRTHLQPDRVLSVSHLNESWLSPAFGNRLEYSREGNRIVITLHDLQEKDSDYYVCAEILRGFPLLSASGTMVLVKEGGQACEKSSWDLYALLTVVALLLCALVGCTLYRVDVKKYFQKKKPNAVYEDMSYNSRRSTLVRSNTYSRGE
ncbi:T-cell antigen CD7 isoform X1 [Sylvia atricapilla]|uniref:T-cell antigen CD7 isoform X1 n=1 Tax=Sylvia atricapilla TaxID=48155 RepID=UPI0033942C82